MTPIGPKDHNWSYLPELGPFWSYCDRCGKALHHKTGKLYTYTQALDQVLRDPKNYHPETTEPDRTKGK